MMLKSRRFMRHAHLRPRNAIYPVNITVINLVISVAFDLWRLSNFWLIFNLCYLAGVLAKNLIFKNSYTTRKHPRGRQKIIVFPSQVMHFFRFAGYESWDTIDINEISKKELARPKLSVSLRLNFMFSSMLVSDIITVMNVIIIFAYRNYFHVSTFIHSLIDE